MHLHLMLRSPERFAFGSLGDFVAGDFGDGDNSLGDACWQGDAAMSLVLRARRPKDASQSQIVPP
jgi:hypothetical protein